MSFVSSIFNFLRFNKKNWKAVVLCLVAATVFWFFIALNKNYSTNISFPVAFEYDEENYIPLKSLPASVRMNVSGLGWNLFRRSSGFKVPALVIPLEKPSDIHKIVGSTLPAIFASQLEGLQINFVITDTLRINIEEKTKRRFNVKIDSIEKYIHEDFGLNTPARLTPDTVWLEGPKEIIKALPETLELGLSQNSIRKNFNEDIELDLEYNHLISRTPPQINVSFEVVKFTRVERKIKLQLINIPANLSVASGIPKEIQCVYRLPVSVAKTFSGDSVVAILDLKNKRQGSHKLVPQALGLPLQADLIKIDTILVNF